jgi:predicted RNase H-like HicB family nuclease
MFTEYIDAAMHRATYERIDDGTFFADIPEMEGLWANAQTLEACRDELQEVLEGWIILGLRLGHTLPVIDGIDLTPELVPIPEEQKAA